MAVLHRITPQLTERYKAVRLRALLDSPMSFGSTYARELAFSEEEWAQRARNLDGQQAAGYIATGNETDCGLAVSFLDKSDASRADLFSMWVAPEARRTGVGVLLVDTLCAWAADRGATNMVLMVTSCNDAAMRFYEKIGFTKTGRTGPYPNDPNVIEHEMIRPLF